MNQNMNIHPQSNRNSYNNNNKNNSNNKNSNNNNLSEMSFSAEKQVNDQLNQPTANFTPNNAGSKLRCEECQQIIDNETPEKQIRFQNRTNYFQQLEEEVI